VSVTRLDGVLDSLGDLSGLGLPLFGRIEVQIRRKGVIGVEPIEVGGGTWRGVDGREYTKRR
jgi:hypothetical protein